jgi:DNA polymerase III delta subunit
LAEGVEPFRILYQISGTIQKQLKAKRLAAAGRTESQISQELRLNYYDRDYMRHLALVSESRLVAELRACVDLEARLKSQSWLDAGTELERFVAAMGK